MNGIGEKAGPRRTIADLLTHERAARRALLAGPGASRTDQHGPGPGDEMDAAGEQAAAATNARLAEYRWSFHTLLDHALDRFRLGLYGVCEDCSEEISLERLRVLPFATRCIDCQRQRERRKSKNLYMRRPSRSPRSNRGTEFRRWEMTRA
jgi:DnaK suppressor protein